MNTFSQRTKRIISALFYVNIVLAVTAIYFISSTIVKAYIAQ